MADREAKVRIGGDTTGLDRALGRARGNLSNFGKTVKRDVGDSLRGAFAGLATVAGFTGLGSLALAARETKLWNDRLIFLQQNTHLSRREILGMSDQIQKAAITFGASQDDLLRGVETYQAITGRAREFSGALEDFAVIAKATNAPLDAIATTAAALNQNLGITSAQFKDAFDVLSAQGDKGAIQFNQMAGLVATLTAQFQRFKTHGVAGVAEMGAMLQIVRHGAGDASEAATQLGALLADLPHHAKELEKAGVNVYSDKAKTQLRDALEIIDEIVRKVPNADLGAVLGERKEARLAFETIRRNRDELGRLSVVAGTAGTNVQKFGIYSASATAGFDRALASLHKTANDLMMGSLPRIAAEFEKVAAAIKWLGDHKDIAIAALAAWKLAPGALGGGTRAAGVGGALGGLAGAGGAVPVYVTNLGPGGLGAGGIAGVGPAAAQAQSGLSKLNRAMDVVSKVFFSFAAGYAVGGVIADAAGLNSNGSWQDVSAYKKYGQFSPDMERNRVHKALFGEELDESGGRFAGALGEAAYQAVTTAPGSARRFHPSDAGIGEGESEADFAKRIRHAIDIKGAPDPVMTKLTDLISVLRERLPAAYDKVTEVKIDGDTVAKASANSRGRRRR